MNRNKDCSNLIAMGCRQKCTTSVQANALVAGAELDWQAAAMAAGSTGGITSISKALDMCSAAGWCSAGLSRPRAAHLEMLCKHLRSKYVKA